MSISSLYEQLDLKYLGVIGNTLFITIGGHKYGYHPLTMTMDQLERSFLSMMKYSPGKALAYLKKNTTLASGSVKKTPTVARDLPSNIQYTGPSTEAPRSKSKVIVLDSIQRAAIGKLRESVDRLVEGEERSLVDTIVLLDNWWESEVGRSIQDAIENFHVDEESTLQRLLYSDNVAEKSSIGSVDSNLMKMYNSVIAASTKYNIYDAIFAVDADKDIGAIFVWFTEGAEPEDISQTYTALKGNFNGTILAAAPEDVECEEPLWFMIVTATDLPETFYVTETARTMSSKQLNAIQPQDIPIDGDIEVEGRSAEPTKTESVREAVERFIVIKRTPTGETHYWSDLTDYWLFDSVLATRYNKEQAEEKVQFFNTLQRKSPANTYEIVSEDKIEEVQ